MHFHLLSQIDAILKTPKYCRKIKLNQEKSNEVSNDNAKVVTVINVTHKNIAILNKFG